MNACAISLHVGDVAHMTCSVKDVAGVLADPTTISVAVTKPDGTTTFNTPTQTGVGLFYFDQPLALAGAWAYKWATTGQNQAVVANGFYVES